jgi:hypothetical protein
MSYDRDRAEKLAESVPLVGVVAPARVEYSTRKIVVKDAASTDMILLLVGLLMLTAGSGLTLKVWVDMQAGSGGLNTWMLGIASGLLIMLGMLMVYVTFWYPRVIFMTLRGRLSIYQWRLSPRPHLTFERDEFTGFEIRAEEFHEGGPPVDDEEGTEPTEEMGHILYMNTHDGLRVPLVKMMGLDQIRALGERFSGASGLRLKTP